MSVQEIILTIISLIGIIVIGGGFCFGVIYFLVKDHREEKKRRENERSLPKEVAVDWMIAKAEKFAEDEPFSSTKQLSYDMTETCLCAAVKTLSSLLLGYDIQAFNDLYKRGKSGAVNLEFLERVVAIQDEIFMKAKATYEKMIDESSKNADKTVAICSAAFHSVYPYLVDTAAIDKETRIKLIVTPEETVNDFVYGETIPIPDLNDNGWIMVDFLQNEVYEGIIKQIQIKE